MTDQQNAPIVVLARETAGNYGLDPALVCAVVEQESGWDPWALRFEPIFERRYIRPALPSAPTTEELCLAISWGLMQVMGKTAREHGFRGKFLNALCDPGTGLSIGCIVLLDKLRKAKGDIHQALLLWNGGSNTAYPGHVISRVTRYSVAG